MSEQNKTYEQARDEAAESHAFNGNYSNNNDEAGSAFAAFKAGADWHRDYSQNINADLLADNKAMREALVQYSGRSKEKERIEWSYGSAAVWTDKFGSGVEFDRGKLAVKTLSQLKGKYDE